MRESLNIMSQCLILLQAYELQGVFDFNVADNKVVPPSRPMMKFSMNL